MTVTMVMAVCRVLFVCTLCAVYCGAVIAGDVAEKDAEGVVRAASLQNYVTVWQRCVVENTSNLLSSLQEAEEKISEGEKAVNEMKKEDLRAQAKKVVDDIKKEITVAKGSATTVKSRADKIQKEMKSANNESKNQQEFGELLNEKKMDELKEATAMVVQLWDPIYKQATTQTKNAEKAASHTTQAESAVKKDLEFSEEDGEDKDKLEKVKSAVNDAKTALGTAATRASQMAGAAKKVEEKLGEMLQAYRRVTEPAGGPHEEGAKNGGGQNDKGDTGAGRENGAADELTTNNEAAESTLRQSGEESSSVDGTFSTTLFSPTLFVLLLFGSVVAAIAAA